MEAGRPEGRLLQYRCEDAGGKKEKAPRDSRGAQTPVLWATAVNRPRGGRESPGERTGEGSTLEQ